jgi:peptide/nickel transport system permease protein
VLSYIARRGGAAIPTLFVVVTLVFLMLRLLPGDPARVIAGPTASPQDVARLRNVLGLNRPIFVQYGVYVEQLVHGNLGVSALTGSPVAQELGARYPYTLELAFASMLIATCVGIPAGIVAATRRGSWLDLVVSAGSVFGLSMPVYWLGLMLIVAFAINLHWLPAAGATSPTGIVLPALTLAAALIALIARMTRASVLEVLRQDYIVTARAKGASALRVLVVHVMRNSLLAVVTAMGLQFGALLGGTVLTEDVFGWPGLGRLMVTSIFSRDYPVVQGAILLFAVTFIGINLFVDVLYAVLDPRIRYR